MQPKSSKSIGPTCDDGETCEHGPSQTPSESTLSAEGSRAKTYRRQEPSVESTASEAGYGGNMQESFAYFDRASWSLRTAQRLLFEAANECCVTLPAWGSMRIGELYRAAPWVLHICASECSSLPTLTKVSCEHPGRQRLKPGQQDCISMALSRRDKWKVGGQYSPNHAAWFMGFPASWTDLDPTATPSCPKSQSGSEGE